MRTRTGPNGSADKHIKAIKRKTRRKFSAEEKIRIVLDGLPAPEPQCLYLGETQVLFEIFAVDLFH